MPFEQASAEPPAVEPEQPASADAGAARSAVVEAATPPTFDIVRVEPDGTAVFAGRAPANAEVSVMSGDTEIARERASASGEFVAIPDKPLAVGDHQIRINARGPDATDTASVETAIVSVPPKGHESDLLVMVERPNEASRLIEVPAEAPAAAGAPVPAPHRDADGSSVASTDGASGETAGLKPPENRPVAAPEAGRPEGTSEIALGVEAVEIEGGMFYVAGSAPPGSTVRLYMDDQFMADADRAEGNRFLLAAPRDISVGPHTIRADAVRGDGTVVARVEVPFDRPAGGTMTAMEASPGAESAIDELASNDSGSGEPAVQRQLRPFRDQTNGASTVAAVSSPPEDEAGSLSRASEMLAASEAEASQVSSAAPNAGPVQAESTARPIPAETDRSLESAASSGGALFVPAEPAVRSAEHSRTVDIPAATDRSLAAPEVPTAPRPAKAASPAGSVHTADLATSAAPEPSSMRREVVKPVREPNKDAGASTAQREKVEESERAEESEPARPPEPAGREQPAATDAATGPARLRSAATDSASTTPVPGATAPRLSPDARAAAHPALASTPRVAEAPEASAPEVASAPKTVVQARLKPVNARVIIRRGDTLWRISKNAYGLGSRYSVIYLANGDQIRNPHQIFPGQVFRMPGGRMAEGRKLSKS